MGATDDAMAAATAGVTLAELDGVAELTLDRPPGNRLGLATLKRLATLIEGLATAGDVRAVWLHAAGEDFSHGVDLRDPELVAQIAAGRESIIELATLGQRMLDGWASLPMPTITSAEGRIVGAGACLFIASDFRIASGSSTICFPEVDRGMYLSWGILPRLVTELGMPLARSLALAGDAVPAGDLPPGSVRIAEPARVDDEGRTLARSLAGKPPLALRAIKATLVATAAPAGSASTDDPITFAATVQSRDFMEAMAAWMAKRPGRYTGE